MNDNNNFYYTPLGTKWLTFLTYVSFPLSALYTVVSVLGTDFSAMNNMAQMVFSVFIFYGIALPIATSVFIHKRRIEGYFLSFLTPVSNAFLYLFLVLVLGSNNPAYDGGGMAGAITIAVINYIYIRKRRHLFTNNEVGPFYFNSVGMRTGLILALAMLVVTTLYSSLLQSNNSVDQAAYANLQEENNTLSTNLENTENAYNQALDEIDTLNDKAQFLDDTVRFVTENGTKYHRYDCHYIKEAPSIYYMFIDDIANYDYTPCSECNP